MIYHCGSHIWLLKCTGSNFITIKYVCGGSADFIDSRPFGCVFNGPTNLTEMVSMINIKVRCHKRLFTPGFVHCFFPAAWGKLVSFPANHRFMIKEIPLFYYTDRLQSIYFYQL